MNSNFFDNMSSFNDALKNIRLRYLAAFIVVCYLVLSLLANFSGFIDTNWVYVLVIFYFMFALRRHFQDFKAEAGSVFSEIALKHILAIVFLNIFFSYGMLYMSILIVECFPSLDFLLGFSIPSMSIEYLPLLGGFISTVIISPISEELIFREIFINKLELVVPTVFAIFISSLLFGALHSFGSMISAFVFAVCMSILYIKTENICVPILAHFINNLFAEIIRIADINNALFTNGTVMAVVGILAIISAILLVKFIAKELNINKSKDI